MSHPRIFCELEGPGSPSSRDPKLSVLTLETFRAIADLTRQKVRLKDGMTVTLYQEKGLEEDREVDGTALFRPHRRGWLFRSWYIEVDLSRTRTVSGLRKEYEVVQPCWGCGRDFTPQLEEGARPEHDRICVNCKTRFHEPFGDAAFADELGMSTLDQECSIPCVECTVLSPHVTPCPACGGSGFQTQAAQMCDTSIQKTYGENSRTQYLQLRDEVKKNPADAETLSRFRDWIRTAVSYSMMYPAWPAAFKSVPFIENAETIIALRKEVQDSLKKDFEEAGRARIGGEKGWTP